MKAFTKTLLALLCLVTVFTANAQTTGTVYRDYNGNGSRQTAAPTIEPLAAGIIVNAYNSSDVLIASYTTTAASAPNYSIPLSGVPYNGTPGSNTGFIALGVAVRLEFVIPASGTCGISSITDYSSNGLTGGASVRFITGGTANVNYAVQNPADYISTTNPSVYIPVFANGNPLGTGTTSTAIALAGFTYTSTGVTLPTTVLTQSQIGTVWGLAYSKPASRLFASAFLKRQHGLGPGNGSAATQPYTGAIYLVNPAASSVSFYCDLDALGFSTHAASGALKVGTNTARGLGDNLTSQFQDPTTFDQVGKVGIGDIDISDDGRFLYIMNLFDRKLYRIDLQNANNPVTPAAAQVKSWSVPNPNPGGANPAGEHRPFALKVYRGKVYVGMVTSGQNAAGTSAASNASMNAYVYEFDPAAASGAGAFNNKAMLTVPLNYNKGIATFITGCDNAAFANWHPWVATNPTPCGASNRASYPQPILSDIEFDDQDGSMILAFIDRYGHQMQRDNNGPADFFTDWNVRSGGDILRAYRNSSCTSWTIESNGDKDGAGTYVAAAAQKNTQGPGGGEFYYLDNWMNPTAERHQEVVLGGLLLLPGSQEVMSTTYDPVTGNAFTEGVTRFSNNTGADNNDYQVVADAAGFGAKGNGLGDIEMVQGNPPIEIGNRVWNDADADGIQDASETGLGGVEMELTDATGTTVIATVTTAANGTYYFSSATGTNATGIVYGVNIQPGTNYIIRVKGTVTATNTITGNTGLGAANFLTKAKITGNGQPDLSDNDAQKVGGTGGRYQVTVTTGSYGQNNHNIDFGFTTINVLPVTLLSFSGNKQNGYHQLQWKTADEVNTHHFELQASDNGSIFNTIAAVTAAGNGNHTYGCRDNNVYGAKVYYRLRIVDVDGRFTFSSIIVLYSNGQGSVSIYPNPVKNMLTLTVGASLINTQAVLQDAKGALIQTIKISGPQQQVNMAGLPGGMYVLKTANGGAVRILKE
jgi:hypothetical protein